MSIMLYSFFNNDYFVNSVNKMILFFTRLFTDINYIYI